MADPLSVVGSAVGIISLGLSVCNTIVEYGRAYRGYSQDIENLTLKAESVSENLESLNDMIKSTQTVQPEAAAILSRGLNRIQQHLTRLEIKIERCGPSQSPENFARKTLKRSKYPFQKGDSREVAADLDSMQQDLQIALQIFSCKQNMQISQAMNDFLALTRAGKVPPSLMKEVWEQQKPHQPDARSSSALTGSRHSIGRREAYTTKTFRVYSRWIGYAIEISFGLKIGAGGFSISQSLKVPVIITRECPAYDDIRGIIDRFFYPRDDGSGLQKLKNCLSDSKFDLSLIVPSTRGDGSLSPLLDQILYHLAFGLLCPGGERDFFCTEAINFLLDHGGSVDPAWWGNLFWSVPRLQAKDVPVLVRLANSGFDFDLENIYFTRHTKRNLMLLLSREETLIKIPESIRLICRENAQDFRKALQQGLVLPDERVAHYPLLEWAFGWPEGVSILLEFDANAKQHFLSLPYPGAGHHSSAVLVLEAGCHFNKRTLEESVEYADGERTMLLAKHLAARRHKLQKFAKDRLPRVLMSVYHDNKILDGPDCVNVMDLLADHKISLPDSFGTEAHKYLILSGGDSVYHGLDQKECAEALYQAGFVDTAMLDSNGDSPFSRLIKYDVHSTWFRELFQWHISKGANIHRRISWANETIIDILTLSITRYASIDLLYFDPNPDHSSHVIRFESNLQDLITIGGDIFFAPTRISDGCVCPCSPTGCTAISMILREVTVDGPPMYQCQQCVGRLFGRLQEWDQSYWRNPRAFIRSLTFNALDLTHTCFAKTKKGFVLSRHRRLNHDDYINDNVDEQSSLDQFEKLVRGLEQKFDELSLPLSEFVPGYWYEQVKDHLLTKPSHDEQHIAGAKELGVDLEFCGLSVPWWMEECIAIKVKELGDED